jgi:hypothetical protein
MPDSTNVNELFRLACCLHPDRAVAIRVLIDGHYQISVTRQAQSRRTDDGHKPRTPEVGLPQMSFYYASEKWEKDQESLCPRKAPTYVPDRDDLLVRFIKNLVYKSLDHRPIYCAVGIGCFLYDYQPNEVSRLSEDVFSNENIRRVKSAWPGFVNQRFAGTRGFANGGGEIPLVAANGRQRALIEKSLAGFAPWSSCADIAVCGRSASLLETYFNGSSNRSHWEQNHVLIDPTCGGYWRLVHEYNSIFGRGIGMRLDEPEKKLCVPKFNDDLDNNPGDAGRSDTDRRFNPLPLTRSELSMIEHLVELNKHRRANYSRGQLRVVVDGEERATFREGFCIKPFTVPTTASWVEIFGEDQRGELLLAAFPLEREDFQDQSVQVMISIAEERKATCEFSLSSTLQRTNESTAIRFFNSFRRFLTEERSKRTHQHRVTEAMNVVTPWLHVADSENDWRCSEQVRALMKKSSLLVNRGQLHEALGLARKALCLDPDFWQARLRCGCLLVETGSLSEGSEYYAYILEHQKENAIASAAAYHNQATELERRFGFRRTEAVNEQIARKYELALELDPLRVMTRAALVCAYQRVGELEKAKQLFKESLRSGEAFIRAIWEELEMSVDSHRLVRAILNWTKNPQWLHAV